MKAKGSLDLLGPSTKRAINALLAGGDPEEVGRRGDTNGAAMRITPVAIAVRSLDLDELVTRVALASRLTHNTSVALAGAAAVAGAVSAGVEGLTFEVMIDTACDAAVRGSRRGHWIAGADVAVANPVGDRSRPRTRRRGCRGPVADSGRHQPGDVGVGAGGLRRGERLQRRSRGWRVEWRRHSAVTATRSRR